MLATARSFTTKKGTFESYLTDEEAIAICSESTSDFARDLIGQYTGRRRPLSQNQWAWVHKIATELAAKKAKPQPEGVDLGDCASIQALFAKAKEHLQYPKITFAVDGQPIVLSLAGGRAKFPGTVNVASARKFGDGVFFGRIMLDGEFQPSGTCTDHVILFLREFALDSVAAARELGRTVGSCIFCTLPLNDDRSLFWGCGKRCADNWGLPWGKIPA